MKFSKLVLGTSQFGSNYGISNKKGILKQKEIKKILLTAQKSDIKFIDTAISYSNANKELSKNNLKNFEIIAKTPKLKNLVLKSNINKYIINNFLEFKKIIGYKKKIYTYLVHSPADIRNKNGYEIYKSIKYLKKKGKVKYIGVCIENMNDIDYILKKNFKIDIIECPLNIFDQRILNYKNLNKLRKRKIKIFARSIFLQGLLIQKDKEIQKYFKKWKKEISNWHLFQKKNGISSLKACMNFILGLEFVDKIIIGVQTSKELSQLVKLSRQKKIELNYLDLKINDINILNSENWKVSK